jgi:CheY-like chemotaxis protein
VAIERNAKLLTQLIDDLLDIARILRGKIALNVTPVNLIVVIESALETVSASAMAKSIAIESNLANVALVSGDATRLQQILWNLLSNAIKFTPNHGKVEISLENTGDRVQITVKDNGKGISSDFLPHVFEYFRQADASITRNHGGLGLGLAIVRYLVELHGGEVAVESPGVGEGATFKVWLPIANQQQTSELTKELPDSQPDLAGVRVLLLDDHPEDLDFLFFALEQYQANLMIVGSVPEALSALESFKPDVLVSDIAMPEMDGYNFLNSVRSLPPELGSQIPAIALTAYAREEDRQKALAAGFQQHLSKPIQTHLLAAAIARCVESVIG